MNRTANIISPFLQAAVTQTLQWALSNVKLQEGFWFKMETCVSLEDMKSIEPQRKRVILSEWKDCGDKYCEYNVLESTPFVQHILEVGI